MIHFHCSLARTLQESFLASQQRIVVDVIGHPFCTRAVGVVRCVEGRGDCISVVGEISFTEGRSQCFYRCHVCSVVLNAC